MSEAFQHPCCRHVRTACRVVEKNIHAGTFQKKPSACTYSQEKVIYVQECLNKKRSGCHSPAMNYSSRRKGCHHRYNHLVCFKHFLALRYVRVPTQKLLCNYVYLWQKLILITRRVLITFKKTAVLGQLQTCLCCREGSCFKFQGPVPFRCRTQTKGISPIPSTSSLN